MRLAFEPRAWQIEAHQLWAKEQRGIVAAVTGSGKTGLALMCVMDFRTANPDGIVVVVVPTVALVDQWALALEEDLSAPASEICALGLGARRWKGQPYAVVVINTARTLAPAIAASRRVMLIVDECHRSGSEHNSRIYGASYPATLGLSATPERQYDDGHERVVAPALGPVLLRYDYVRAARDGVIAPFNIVNVRFCLSPGDQRAYDSLTRRVAAILRSDDGNRQGTVSALLRRRARISWNSALRTPLATRIVLQNRRQRAIVFHESVSHAKQIHGDLIERGVRATIYHAAMPEVVRKENLRLFRSGFFTAIVCCRALDEGLNVPETSLGLVASGTSSIRQRIQRLGRVLRRTPTKEAATVYTLYATECEARRLMVEAKSLVGVAHTTWLAARVRADVQADH